MFRSLFEKLKLNDKKKAKLPQILSFDHNGLITKVRNDAQQNVRDATITNGCNIIKEQEGSKNHTIEVSTNVTQSIIF